MAALLIAGDLFDGRARSARTAAFLAAQLDRLRAAGIPVFYIKGNHDAENPITGALDLPDNVHVFDARGGKVHLAENLWIHGVSFADRHAPDSLLPRFPAPVPGAVNIAMLHTSLAGAAGHDTYAPCSVGDLTGMGFDYWALGHVHKRQVHGEAPWVVMPGMPQGRDIGEAGAKSASLLTVAGGRIDLTEVPTSGVEFIATTLDISDAGSEDALRAALRDHLRGVTDAVSSDAGHAGHAGSATDELASLMAEINDEPGFAAAARAEIEEVIGDLPQSVRAALMPDAAAAEALTDRLATAGARRVLARMKGAEG